MKVEHVLIEKVKRGDPKAFQNSLVVLSVIFTR